MRCPETGMEGFRVVPGGVRCDGSGRWWPVHEGLLDLEPAPSILDAVEQAPAWLERPWVRATLARMGSSARTASSVAASRLLLDAGTPPTRVLDVACGDGRFVAAFGAGHPSRVVVGLDRSRLRLRLAVQRHGVDALDGGWPSGRAALFWVVSTAERPPFLPASFDAVHCAGGLERLPEPAAALQAWARLIEPGGRLVLSVSVVRAQPLVRRLQRGVGGNAGPFEPGLLLDRVEASGFTVREKMTAGGVLHLLAVRHGAPVSATQPSTPTSEGE